jgi:hypothetical protein
MTVRENATQKNIPVSQKKHKKGLLTLASEALSWSSQLASS